MKSRMPPYRTNRSGDLNRTVDGQSDGKKNGNRLLNINCFIRRRLNGQHAITDRFANILFMFCARPSLDSLVTH